jgi:hypothetical protein
METDGQDRVVAPADAGLKGEWETVDAWQGEEGSSKEETAKIKL